MSEPEPADWQALSELCEQDPHLDARIADGARALTPPQETQSDSDPVLVRWQILRDSRSTEECRERLTAAWSQAHAPSLRKTAQSYLTLRHLLTPRGQDSVAESVERILDWAMLEECAWLERETMPAEFVESVFEAIHQLHRDPVAQSLFQEFCEITVARTKLPLAWIALRSADDPLALTIEGRAGTALVYLDSLRVNLKADEPWGQGPAAMAIRTGVTQVIQRTSEDERFQPWRELAQSVGLGSVVALPIRVHGAVVGALAVYAHEEGFFTEARIQVATGLSTALGLKLEEHAREEPSRRLLRFYRATHAINALVTRRRPFEEVIAAACRLSVEDTGLKLAYIVRINTFKNTPDILYASGPGKGFLEGLTFDLTPEQPDSGISALAIAARAPILVNRFREDPRFSRWYARLQTYGLASGAAFPILEQNKAIWGVIVFLASEPDFFDTALVEHLASITRNLSLVIEDELRQARLLRVESFYSVLAEISEFLATDPPAGTLVQKACDLACAAADLPVAYVTLIDPKTETVHLEAFSGRDSGLIQRVPISVDPEHPEGRGITGIVYRTRRPRIVNLSDPESTDSIWLSDAERQTLAAIAGFPLLVDNRCQGVLSLGASTSGFFDAGLCGLLERVAENLSIGLSRSQEKMERIRFENLYHALADVYRLVARNPKPEFLYREICANLLQLHEIDGIGIFQIAEPPVDPHDAESAERTELTLTAITSPTEQANLPDFCQDLAHLAAEQHQPVFAGPAEAPSLSKTLSDALARSALKEIGAFPVRHRSRIPAVLVITSREAGYFKPATTTRLCLQVCEAMTLALAEYEREQELRLMAFTDSLTHLPNRNLFSDRLDSALIQAERTQAIVGVGILDIDHFKEINDRFGHDAGDAVLATTARRLEAVLNRESTAARLAGDEFGLILIGLSAETEITGILERLRAELSQPIRYRDYLLPVTVSLGVTFYPQDPVGARTLLRHADLALYRAKARGRNAWALFEEHFERLLESRISLHSHLRTALQSEEVESHLQPVIDLSNGKIVGAEAFARWRDHALEKPANADWLATIEDDPPLLLETGRYLLNALGRELRHLDQHDITIPLSLNINLRYLLSPHFAEDIQHWIQDFGPYASRMVLELKPSALLSDWNRLPNLLEEVRQHGISIVLDNFGTWPISLRNLQHLHSRGIKLDRNFLLGLTADPRAASLVAGAVRSGEVGGYEVTAVGVETLEIAELYLALGGQLAQGFALAPAMPRIAFLKWMQTWQRPAAFDALGARTSHSAALPFLLSQVHHRWCQRIIDQLAHVSPARQKILLLSLEHQSCPRTHPGKNPIWDSLSTQHEALHDRLAQIIESCKAGQPDFQLYKEWAAQVAAYEARVRNHLEHDCSPGGDRTEEH
ncbi:MAG: bifunctional diguanylate cyclase/phosphodiesterase [Gammaproteobacteria bacterium]